MWLIGKLFVKSAQGSIDRLNPKVTVHLPLDLPVPSTGMAKRMSVVASRINALEETISQLSDDQLKVKTPEFRQRYQEAIKDKQTEWLRLEEEYKKVLEPAERDALDDQFLKLKEDLKISRRKILDGILPEAFAVVREVSKRILNMRHFDTQLIGGMVLHEGNIAEMATGEGKTLVATLPAYLNAITGEGVHVVTVNDYLAKRDREWMGPIYEFLGISVGVIQHDMDNTARREAYGCDITYGTNNEFGFDYLRDNMVSHKEEMVQRGHYFAIVDEVDSILVDEARTPLIISGPAEESTDKYYRARDIVSKLTGRRITESEEIDAKRRDEDLSKGFDYTADEKARSVALTEQGEEKAAKAFGIDNLHDMETVEYRHHILQALKAREFFRVDVDYVVRDGEVIIVDEFTGRLMPGRRWSDGLHQAVEAKEGIKIARENQTLATITFQNYFRMYEKLAGMTGTAYTEANEFKQIYNLDCVVVPTNRKMQRVNHTDCIYKTVKEKYEAVVAEIEDYHRRGQPVLVGTISIEKSELISAMLKRKGVPHQVLNAKYHELEAQIVAQAGRFKAVTIATNMAGRGTDIVLGGNAEFLAKSLAEKDIKTEDSPEEKEATIRKFLRQFREQVKVEHEQVVAAGGLHVLGTERHESRRIDNQLRGRSGRQGDPGSSRFYVSLQDDLMRLFASDRIVGMMDKLGMEEGQVIEHPWVSGALEVAQKRVENHNFEIRKQLLEYDNVMNKQREAIYHLRRSILNSDNVKDRILSSIGEVANILVQQYLFSAKDAEEQDWAGLETQLKASYNFDLSPQAEQLKGLTQVEIEDAIIKGLTEVYDSREKDIPPEHLRQLEKIIFLNTIDAKWKDHLYAMDQLKDGVGLRSYGQRDPLVEYKREGFMMFQMMYDTIYQEIVARMFQLQPAKTGAPERIKGVFSSIPQKFIHQDFSGINNAKATRQAEAEAAPASMPPGMSPREAAPSAEPYHKNEPKVGRNDPCPCGSGKKYKKCCGT